MLKRRKPPKLGIRKAPQVRCAAHLQWIRRFYCAAEKHGGCGGKIEAHHVREGADGGIGLKPGDDTAIPLCSVHHRMFHDGNLSSAGWDVLAGMLAKESPHLRKMRND